METVAEFVDNLNQKGVKFWVEQDKLKIHSPKGIITSEVKTQLADRKAEILGFLQSKNQPESEDCHLNDQNLSIQTIGRLIGGFSADNAVEFKTPIVNPKMMAKRLKVTLKPLPKNYQNPSLINFRKDLELKLRNHGVEIVSWQQATKDFSSEIKIPFTPFKKQFKTKVVKSGISAVINVERKQELIDKIKAGIAEKAYQFYSQFILKNQKISVTRIAQLISWAELNIQPLEDPSNTQVITLTDINPEFIDANIPYQQKIPTGVNTLVRTFSEIVIGVSPSKISLLNMNLSDSIFSAQNIDEFVLNSLIPKIYVPILPLPMSRFELGKYNPIQSEFAVKLVQLGKELASTHLLPSGFKIDTVIQRQSYRDIVDWMVNGRTGVSYGFVAYVEPPKYIGSIEITQQEWINLLPVQGLNKNEIRQNKNGRKYVKMKAEKHYKYQQIPDIWVVSSRSGSNKTNLNLETDILRIGLSNTLSLQLPENINPETGDIKPSYDIYVMLGIALSAALYTPELIKNGAPIVHFHGYPSLKWFKSNHEYCTGVHNPSVPCGTYESGVFNFLGMASLSHQFDPNIQLACLVEPDHGSNFIAKDSNYLITRLKTGVQDNKIELGGKHFSSLKTGSKV
jgi:hypothetical protein